MQDQGGQMQRESTSGELNGGECRTGDAELTRFPPRCLPSLSTESLGGGAHTGSGGGASSGRAVSMWERSGGG